MSTPQIPFDFKAEPPAPRVDVRPPEPNAKSDSFAKIFEHVRQDRADTHDGTGRRVDGGGKRAEKQQKDEKEQRHADKDAAASAVATSEPKDAKTDPVPQPATAAADAADKKDEDAAQKPAQELKAESKEPAAMSGPVATGARAIAAAATPNPGILLQVSDNAARSFEVANPDPLSSGLGEILDRRGKDHPEAAKSQKSEILARKSDDRVTFQPRENIERPVDAARQKGQNETDDQGRRREEAPALTPRREEAPAPTRRPESAAPRPKDLPFESKIDATQKHRATDHSAKPESTEPADSARPAGAQPAPSQQPDSEQAPTSSNSTVKSLIAEVAAKAEAPRAATPQEAAAQKAAQLLEESPADLVNQIVQRARLFTKDGQNTMEVQLKPDLLGKLIMRVEVFDHRMTAMLTVQSDQVRQMLESQLQSLQSSLEASGLKLHRLTIQVAEGQQPDNQQPSDWDRQQQQAQEDASRRREQEEELLQLPGAKSTGRKQGKVQITA